MSALKQHAHTTAYASDVRAALADCAQLLRDEAADSERLRRPTPSVRQALFDSGVFELMVPVELGGPAASPLEVFAVMEQLSHIDASLGWLVRAVMTETGLAATYLSGSAIEELYADGRRPLMAGQSTSYTGSARTGDGGFVVDGSWQFAPGVSVATHLNLSVTDENGVERVCVVPRSSAWLSDEWDMLGLRATASLNYAVRDLFVPDEWTFRIRPGSALRGGVCSRMSPALMAGLHQAAWSQGIARRMLDELRELTQRRDPVEGGPVSSDEFFAEFARRYSHVRGTDALIKQTWTDVEASLQNGDRLTDDQETMVRLASSLATRTSLETGQLVHRFAGGHVMHNGVLQRFFRDSHAGTQHRGASSVVVAQCGRMLAGSLPAGTHWGFFELQNSPEAGERP